MLTALRLRNFKNFKNAELLLGDFTTVIGGNATGKSNIRDAFRFLHGLARGYALADIIGNKYAEGELVWSGIRGGTREISFRGGDGFALELDFVGPEDSGLEGTYMIEVRREEGNGLTIAREQLTLDQKVVYQTPGGASKVEVFGKDGTWGMGFSGDTPALTKVVSMLTSLSMPDQERAWIFSAVEAVHKPLLNLRFFDLDPQAMRQPSFPGQRLGDRGENLSSALQMLCRNSQTKASLLSWVQELTPMDAVDMDFVEDHTGRVILDLLEADGARVSVFSASDGTLRFLTLLAGLLVSEQAGVYFFEELENGLHPSRLFLLLQLMEQRARAGAAQILTTTHSPQLLRFLGEASREQASLTYRKSGSPEAGICRLGQIPGVQQVLANEDWARLHESGWFEDAIDLLDDEIASS